MATGECQTKNRNEYDKEEEEKIVALDEGSTVFLLCRGAAYA